MLELPGPHHITLWKSGFKEVQKKRTAEGHAPTPPGKGWKPQRPAEQAATERCWNRQKKIPHMKRQRRVRDTAEGVQLRWNQIPYLPGDDAQTAEQLTTEVLPLLWRFWAPHQSPSLRVQQRDQEPPGNPTLQASGLWLQDFHGTGGDRGYTQDQGGGAGAPQETEPSLPIVLEGLLQRCGWQWFTLRTRGLAGAVLRSTSWCEFSWRPPQARPQRLEAQGWVLRPNN